MSDRERKQTKGNEAEEADVETADQPSAQGEELTDKIDDLLDEIDSVLEENAEEFVKNYVQKGGE
jgi:ubiquitin-like protein Pup